MAVVKKAGAEMTVVKKGEMALGRGCDESRWRVDGGSTGQKV